LLRREREAEGLHREEADAVVAEEENALEEERPLDRRDREFSENGDDRDEASAGGRFQHREIFFRGSRDVVFSGFSRMFDELSREQVEVHLEKAPRRAAIDVRSHELEEEIACGEERSLTAVSRVDDADEKIEASEVRREGFEFVNESQAHAAVFDDGERVRDGGFASGSRTFEGGGFRFRAALFPFHGMPVQFGEGLDR
jgi:hypothetical protein